MKSNVELSEQAKKACAAALTAALADSYVLYLKTHNFHWNVEGPDFYTLHKLFEEQYLDLWASVDLLAERIRSLGSPAPGTYAKFQAAATIRDNEEIPTSSAMVQELLADNRTAEATTRSALRAVQDAGDEATAGVLTERLAYFEKQIWMMGSMIRN